MKSRFPLSVLFVLMIAASAPARASDALTQFFFEASAKLLTKAGGAVVSSVKNAIVPKETEEERIKRETAEIETAADQILAQYPEDEREARKAEVMARLTGVYDQYKTMEPRQQAIRDEQNSIGNILADTAVSSASTVIGNRIAIDSAARSAMAQRRF